MASAIFAVVIFASAILAVVMLASAILTVVTESSCISPVPVGSSPTVNVNVTAVDSEPNGLSDETLAT